MLGVTLRWTSIPSLRAVETTISSGLLSHLARMPLISLPCLVTPSKKYYSALLIILIGHSGNYKEIDNDNSWFKLQLNGS